MALIVSLKPRRKIDLNNVATEVARLEGGKKNLDIAQVSEVQRHVLDIMAEQWQINPRGLAALLERRGSE